MSNKYDNFRQSHNRNPTPKRLVSINNQPSSNSKPFGSNRQTPNRVPAYINSPAPEDQLRKYYDKKLQDLIDHYQDRINIMTTDVHDRKSEMIRLKDELHRISSDLYSLEESNKKMDHEFGENQSRLASNTRALTKRLSDKARDHQILEEKLYMYENMKSQVGDDKKFLLNKIQSLELDILRINEQTKKLEDNKHLEMQRLTDEMLSIKAAVDEKQKINQILDQQAYNLSDKLSNTENDTQIAINQIIQENERMHNVNNELNDQILMKNKDISALFNDQNAMKNDMDLEIQEVNCSIDQVKNSITFEDAKFKQIHDSLNESNRSQFEFESTKNEQRSFYERDIYQVKSSISKANMQNNKRELEEIESKYVEACKENELIVKEYTEFKSKSFNEAKDKDKSLDILRKRSINIEQDISQSISIIQRLENEINNSENKIKLLRDESLNRISSNSEKYTNKKLLYDELINKLESTKSLLRESENNSSRLEQKIYVDNSELSSEIEYFKNESVNDNNKINQLNTEICDKESQIKNLNYDINNLHLNYNTQNDLYNNTKNNMGNRIKSLEKSNYDLFKSNYEQEQILNKLSDEYNNLSVENKFFNDSSNKMIEELKIKLSFIERENKQAKFIANEQRDKVDDCRKQYDRLLVEKNNQRETINKLRLNNIKIEKDIHEIQSNFQIKQDNITHDYLKSQENERNSFINVLNHHGDSIDNYINKLKNSNNNSILERVINYEKNIDSLNKDIISKEQDMKKYINENQLLSISNNKESINMVDLESMENSINDKKILISELQDSALSLKSIRKKMDKDLENAYLDLKVVREVGNKSIDRSIERNTDINNINENQLLSNSTRLQDITIDSNINNNVNSLTSPISPSRFKKVYIKDDTKEMTSSRFNFKENDRIKSPASKSRFNSPSPCNNIIENKSNENINTNNEISNNTSNLKNVLDKLEHSMKRLSV